MELKAPHDIHDGALGTSEMAPLMRALSIHGKDLPPQE